MVLLWFLIFSREIDNETLTLVVTIAWVMWSNRNNKRHWGKVKTNQVVIQRSIDYIREYQTANENPVIAKDVGYQTWIPSADYVYKVNEDGVIFQTQHQAGIGVLVHGSQGMMIVATSKKLLLPYGPKEVEPKAFVEGLLFAHDIAIQEIILQEGDSLVIVNCIAGKSSPPSSIASVLYGINSLSHEFCGFQSFYQQCIWRNGNIPARSLFIQIKKKKKTVHLPLTVNNVISASFTPQTKSSQSHSFNIL